jgi:hypothetical protein
MHPVLAKTLGGLTTQYYFRQFFFGFGMAVVMYFFMSLGTHGVPIPMIFFMAVTTLLYPYSRFVYESVVNFIMGDTVFFTSISLMLGIKFVTIAMCWAFALFVAPIGLAYLYFHHSKASSGTPNGAP